MKLPAHYVPGQGVVKPSGFGGLGERLLRGMGWEAGQGLGAQGQGMAEALEVKKKEDAAGVGQRAGPAWEDKWWERGFDAAAAAVDIASAGGDSSSDSSSDDDAGGAGGGAARNRDGTVASGSAQELRLMAQLSKAGGKVAAGRFGGRGAKLARIRAQEAREAGSAAAALAAAADPPPPARRAKVDVSAATAAATAPARPRIVIEPAVAAPTGAAHAFVPTRLEGWWGAATFAPAGCLEGLAKREGGDEPATFDEDMQAGIYEAAQAGKTQGRVGLGQRSRTVKVGGVAWEGSKVTFGEGGGGGAAADGKPAAAADGGGAGSDGGDAAEGGWEARAKLKKRLLKILGAAPGGALKLKALHAAVAEAVAAAAPGKRALRAAVEAKLAASSRFKVDGRVVRLAASK
jgi:hypothetical protein